MLVNDILMCCTVSLGPSNFVVAIPQSVSFVR